MAVQDALAFVISTLAPDSVSSTCATPPLVPVPIEFSTYRPLRTFLTNRFRHRTPSEIYHEMTSSLPSNHPVVLHMHGGAHCLMSPSTHRPFTTLLSARSSSLIISPSFRLSPQHPCPAALLDCFITYLSLISPPPSSFYAPIAPSHIILSGDSSGAGLAASLSLLLLTLRKHNISILWHGRTITIPLAPHAGMTLISPWLDVTRSLPSTTLYTKYDIIAPPPLDAASPPFPRDEIWPTTPPRCETYCTAAMGTHPLVSPLAARAEMWEGVGRVYVCVGWEAMSDEAEVFGRRVHEGGGEVVFDGYEGMPHCFAMMPWGRVGWEANERWAGFVSGVVGGDEGGTEEMSVGFEKGWGRWKSSKDGSVKYVKLGELGMGQTGCGYERKEKLSDEVVEKTMEEGRRWRVGLDEQMIAAWKSASDMVS